MYFEAAPRKEATADTSVGLRMFAYGRWIPLSVSGTRDPLYVRKDEFLAH